VGKTGTSSLQLNLFKNLTTVDCLGRPNHHGKEFASFFHSLHFSEDAEFENKAREFRDFTHLSPNRRVIISHEGFRSDVNSFVARRLHTTFPSAQILITVRNQVDAITSHYVSIGRHLKGIPHKQRVNMHVPFDDYFDFNSGSPHRGYFRQLDYDLLRRVYADFFGAENVHILLFENMAAAHPAYFEELARILDAPVDEVSALMLGSKKKNAGDSARQVQYAKLRSLIPIRSIRKKLFLPEALGRRIDAFLRSGNRMDVVFTPEHRSWIEEFYGPGNRRLMEELGLPLDQFGYPGAVSTAGAVEPAMQRMAS